MCSSEESSQTGKLYVVGTPIGNLGDITIRALETLKSVNIVAAEDTRRTRKLFSHFDIHTPLTSFHEHTRAKKLQDLIGRLSSGNDVALVTDAGTPGISDPGSWLIQHACNEGIPVVPIPGVSALTTAISVSMIRCDQFTFLGFLPVKKKKREDLILRMAAESRSFVFFESPYRIKRSMEDLARLLPDHMVCMARELTKVYEEIKNGLPESILELLKKPKGEFTVIVERKK